MNAERYSYSLNDIQTGGSSVVNNIVDMACTKTYTEPQKMASFLKDRCDQGMYGLWYYDTEKTLICIPWPTVPKQSEPVPDAFHMFKEWAVLSFIKRGTNGVDASREGYSTQKHRFRNALTRADGLKFREELSKDGIRVYELPKNENYGLPIHSPNLIGSPGNVIPQQHLPIQQSAMVESFACENNISEDDVSRILGELNFDEDTENASGWPVESYPQQQPQAQLPAIPCNGQETLLLKISYRGETVSVRNIQNLYGCRLYFGNNIPDMSKLIDAGLKKHLENSTKFPTEYYFGPEKFLQIQMPDFHCARNTKQLTKTKCILENMNRGLILLLSHDYVSGSNQMINIPNVFGIRLCQTRVYPYECNVINADELKFSGLQRIQRTLIFDALDFQRMLYQWQKGCGPRPSATIRLSIGQKPLDSEKTGTHNFVTMEVVVKAAEALLIQTEDNCSSVPDQGVAISVDDSMDREARKIGDTIVQAITLN